MAESGQAPSGPIGVDLEKPNPARIYDWTLGGAANYAIDREFGKQVQANFPLMKPTALSNRRWLGRLVEASVHAGIRQWLDLGSGVPTAGNVHQIVADALGPDLGRVVYVDYEHIAVEHSRMTLAEEGVDSWTGIIHEDYRRPEAILNHETTTRLLDFRRPVCVIMASVLQFVGGDDQPADLIARYTASLAPGSWFAASHLAVDDAGEEGAAEIRGMFDAYTRAGNPAWLRDRAEFASWFDGLEPVSPGVVHAVDWRPDEDPDTVEASRAIRPFYWAGVGQVPPPA